MVVVSFVFLAGSSLKAQDITAFLDYRERMIVFDHGTFTELEPLRPKAIGVGGDYIAYADATGDVKLYRNGSTTRLDRSNLVEPQVTDHFFGFDVAGSLKLHDGVALHSLCGNTGGYVVEDSIAGWFDVNQSMVRAWWQGQEYELEDALANDPVRTWKSGDNLLAWVTNVERKLKVFYRGYIQDVADVFDDGVDYKAGADVVAYVDPRGMGLKAFYQGDPYDLEAFKPTSYQVGKGIVAWVDITGSLKVLEDGKVYTATSYAPQEYHVKDSIVVYRDQDRLMVFQDGKVHEVERFWPEEWGASWGALAYRGADRTVRIWRKGVGEVALREQTAQRFTLERGLLVMYMPLNTVKVWWRGEVYTH
jgi:hypothetical protein